MIIGCILLIMGIIGMILVIIGGLGGEQSLLCGVIGGVLVAISSLFAGEIALASLSLVFSLFFLYDLGKLRMEWLAKLSIILACILGLTLIILGRIIIGIVFLIVMATFLIIDRRDAEHDKA